MSPQLKPRQLEAWCKVGPGPGDPGTQEPGSCDPGPPSKFKSGTLDRSEV